MSHLGGMPTPTHVAPVAPVAPVPQSTQTTVQGTKTVQGNQVTVTPTVTTIMSHSPAGVDPTVISTTAWTNSGYGITIPAIANGGNWVISATSRIVLSANGPAGSYGWVLLRLFDATTGTIIPNSGIVTSIAGGTAGQESVSITPLKYNVAIAHVILLQALAGATPGATVSAEFYSDANGGTYLTADLNAYTYFAS